MAGFGNDLPLFTAPQPQIVHGRVDWVPTKEGELAVIDIGSQSWATCPVALQIKVGDLVSAHWQGSTLIIDGVIAHAPTEPTTAP